MNSFLAFCVILYVLYFFGVRYDAPEGDEFYIFFNRLPFLGKLTYSVYILSVLIGLMFLIWQFVKLVAYGVGKIPI